MAQSTPYERWINAFANALLRWSKTNEDGSDVVSPVIALIAEADKNKYVLPAFGGFQSLWKEFETQELTFGGQTGRNHVNKSDDLSPPTLPSDLVQRAPVRDAVSQLEAARVYLEGEDKKIMMEVIKMLQDAIGSGVPVRD